MADDWKSAKANAEKMLGKKGKLPKPRVDIDTVMAAETKAWASLSKAREELEKQIVDYETAIDKIKNANKQYNDVIDADSFGLDKKGDDDKKIIDQVQKYLDGYFSTTNAMVDKLKDRLDKLDKFLTDFSKLDGVSG